MGYYSIDAMKSLKWFTGPKTTVEFPGLAREQRVALANDCSSGVAPVKSGLLELYNEVNISIESS